MLKGNEWGFAVGLGVLCAALFPLAAMDGPGGAGGMNDPDHNATIHNAEGPEEAKRQRSLQAVPQFDKNHDGQLDASERAAMQAAGFTPPGPEANLRHDTTLSAQKAEQLTAAEFQKNVAAMRVELGKLKTLPDDLKTVDWKTLKTKAISMGFNGDTAAVWEIVARAGDIGHLGSSGLPAAEFTSHRFLYIGVANLQMAQSLPKVKWAPPEPIWKTLAGIGTPDTCTLDDSVKTAEITHKFSKLFVLHPPVNMVESWSPEQAGEACRTIDAIKLPFESWYKIDADPKKATSIGKLSKLVTAIRKTNPGCRIFLDVGRVDPGPEAEAVARATAWCKMLSTVAASDPKLFDGIHFAGNERDKTDDPSVGPTKQFLAWLRLN